MNTRYDRGRSANEVTVPVDYSIQPGEGGWGLEMQWAGYRHVGKDVTLYTDRKLHRDAGRNKGGDAADTLSTTTPLENYDSIADQYFLEGGTAFPVNYRLKGLSATLALRDEGVRPKTSSRIATPVSAGLASG